MFQSRKTISIVYIVNFSTCWENIFPLRPAKNKFSGSSDRKLRTRPSWSTSRRSVSTTSTRPSSCSERERTWTCTRNSPTDWSRQTPNQSSIRSWLTSFSSVLIRRVRLAFTFQSYDNTFIKI